MTDVFIEVEKVNDVDIVLTAVTGGVLPDGIVENTDDSYSDTVANGSTLIIPDINIIKNNDSVVTSPAAIDLDLRIIDPASAPSGWNEQIAEYGRGYNYPMPDGNDTVYRLGDSASIEASIFAPVRVANSLKVQNSLVDFLTLGNTNSFGNTNRLTDINGLQVYADGLIIDNYTGLMYYKTYLVADNWNNQIDSALASTQGGYTDWFVSNRNQSESLIKDNLLNYAPFLTSFNYHYCSTTRGASTTTATRIANSNAIPTWTLKTNSYTSIMCRKHF